MKKMKWIMSIVAIIAVAFSTFMFVSCNKSDVAELTDLEKEMVGTWLMDDAKLQSTTTVSYFYPDGPQGFKSEVAKYYNKAKIVFYNEKTKTNGVKGELIIGNEKYTFYWTREAKKVIKVKSFPQLSYNNGTATKTAYIDTIYIATDGTYLNINFSSGLPMVIYYFDRVK